MRFVNVAAKHPVWRCTQSNDSKVRIVRLHCFNDFFKAWCNVMRFINNDRGKTLIKL